MKKIQLVSVQKRFQVISKWIQSDFNELTYCTRDYKDYVMVTEITEGLPKITNKH